MFNTGNCPSVPIVANLDGNNGNNWNDGSWLWFLIVVFAIFGGWGNGFGGFGGANGGVGSEIQRGFDNSAVISKLDGIGSHKDNMCIAAMCGRNPDNPSDRTVGSPTEQRLEVNMQGTSNCLTSVQKDNLLLENNIQKVGQISSNGSQCGTVISDNGISANLVAGTHGYANSHIATQYRIRKLTPRECGRLMGVSDEDIDKMSAINSNTQLYKQFGNSIVVDVMCAMFKNLNIKQGDSNEALQTN